jgi:hypothetical protein
VEKTQYKPGDVVEVQSRSTVMILLGRYRLVSRHGMRREAWEAKHVKSGRLMTLYEDEFVSPGRTETPEK